PARPGQLNAMAARISRIAESRASASRSRADDLIVGIYPEQRGGQQPSQSIVLDADFIVVAGEGLQGEVQSRLLVGAVGQFVERRCFEAAARSGIQAGVRRQGI